MKLYTEEQLKTAYIDGMDFIAVDPTKYEQDAEEYVRDVYPVELPSDDEIEQIALDFAKKYRATTYEISALIIGAKWMRDKLTSGNNERK